MCVASLQGGLRGGRDVRERTFGKRPGGGNAIRELDAIPVRLFEVVADDQPECTQIADCAALEPTRELFVELGALAFGNRPIGRIADQQMPEVVRLVVGHVRAVAPDQVAAAELGESSREPSKLGIGEQLGERARQNVRPTTAAHSSTRRSASGRRSSRAPRSMLIVGGIGSADSVRSSSRCSSTST